MKKILASLAAAAVLVAGIATAAVVTGSAASAQETPDAETTGVVERPEPGAAVREVLEELVAAGEIELTNEEIDAILDALAAKREEHRAEHPEEHRRGPGFRHGFRRGAHLGLRVGELLADGVIDADELASLPEGHPLTNPEGPFAAAAADGEITEQEFRDVLAQIREERKERRDAGFGPGFGDEPADVEGSNV